MNGTKQPMTTGQTIPYSVGRIEITLRYVRPGAYTVTTYQGGTLRIEDNCGSYTTESEARAVARLYAEQYKAEYTADLLHDLHAAQRHPNGAERAARIEAELDSLETPAQRDADRVMLDDIAETIRTASLADTVPAGTYRQVAPTMAGAQLAKVSDPLMLILATAASNGGTIIRSAQANVRQLMSLVRKGLATLNYEAGRGNRKVVESATLTKQGYAAVKAVA